MTTAEASSEPSHGAALLGLFHGLALVTLIALRPLVWDGDATAPANLAWLACALVQALLVAGECAIGRRDQVRWGWGGALLMIILVGLCVAAWRAPIPATGWTLWIQYAVVGGWLAAVAQIAPGRERLIVAGVVAGLAGQCVVGLLQPVWVFPAMTAAQQAGELALGATGINSGDFAERVARGGVYGTFTLANTLAAHLLLVVPLVAALVWTQGTTRTIRVTAGLLAVAAVVVLYLASSKGAYVAAGLAGGALWLSSIRGCWRWLPVGLGVTGCLAVACLPVLQAPFAASASVRWGYWTGAARMIAETPLLGQGIGSFVERGPALMPLWAEPSRLVHNEVLEMAVIAGIPAAIALLALLIWLACGTARIACPLLLAPRRRLVLITLPLAVTYLSVLGMLDGNLGWWPGAGNLLATAGWSLLLGLVMAFAAVLCWTAAVPERRWWSLGIGALALHALIDFDLHSVALVALLGVLACGTGVARTSSLPRTLRIAPLMIVCGLAVLLVWGAGRGLALRQAEDKLAMLRLALTGTVSEQEQAFSVLAIRAGEPVPQDARSRQQLWRSAHAQAWAQAEADPRLRLQLATCLPPGRQRAEMVDIVVVALPNSSLAASLQAEDRAAQGHWAAAVDAAQCAVQLAPASLHGRRTLVRLYERASVAQPSRAATWLAARDAAQAELDRLTPIVNPRNH